MSLATLTSEKRQLQDDHQEFIKQRAQMEFSVKDLEQNVAEDQSNRVNISWPIVMNKSSL